MRQAIFTKGQKVTLPKEDRFDDVVAVQLVKYSINFGENKITGIVDTKILEDGRQIVVNGDGWIKEGTEIENENHVLAGHEEDDGGVFEVDFEI